MDTGGKVTGRPALNPKRRPPLVPQSDNLEPISSHIHKFFFIPFPPSSKTTCLCNILKFYYIQSKYILCKLRVWLYDHDWPYSSVLIYFLTHLLCTRQVFPSCSSYSTSPVPPPCYSALSPPTTWNKSNEILRWCCYLFAYSSADMGQAGRRQSFLREPGPSKTWVLDWQVILFKWRCMNVCACVFLHTTQWGPKKFSTNTARTYLQVLTILKAV